LAKTPPLLIPRLTAFARITCGAFALCFPLNKHNHAAAHDHSHTSNVAVHVPQTLRFCLFEKALFQSHFSARYNKARDRRGLVGSEV
jgi:hypothetical protein